MEMEIPTYYDGVMGLGQSLTLLNRRSSYYDLMNRLKVSSQIFKVKE